MKETVCAEWEERLSLYVDGLLNPFDENAVEAHLSRCDSCRKTVALWKAVGTSIRRTPNYLPPPYLRERILNSTTRRKPITHRFRPAWWQWAPALGLGLLVAWLTLPQPSTEKLLANTPTTNARESVIATIQSVEREPVNQPAPVPQLVVVVESNPAFRVVQAEPRWIPSTRLSTVAPMATEGTLNPNQSASGNLSSPSVPIITAIADAESSEPIVLPPPTVSVVSTLPATSGSPTNPSNRSSLGLAEWRREFNEQLRRDRRVPFDNNQRKEQTHDRFVVPIVTINLK